MSQFFIGQEVRLYLNGFNNRSQTAMIATINDTYTTVDLVIRRKSNSCDNIQEIDNVSIDMIKPLESFEYEQHKNLSPLDIKNNANRIFSLHDYDRAAELYLTALSLLMQYSRQISVGSEILIQLCSNPLEFEVAMVIIIDNENGLEIEYENESFNQIEELTVLKSKATLLVKSLIDCYFNMSELELLLLQRSIYINLSRCCMKRKQPGWSVRYVSMSMAITRSLILNLSNNANIDGFNEIKFVSDELWIRSKAFLLANKTNLAKKVL